MPTKTANKTSKAVNRPNNESDENTGGEPDLDRALGFAVRRERQLQGLTIAQVSDGTGLSRGMLSKIENGQASMSLDSLSRIAVTLGVSMSNLLKPFETQSGGAQHIKRGSAMEVVRRGTKRGHTYHLLAYDQGPRKFYEPFLISMDDESEVFPTFEHPGTEFIYMLQGEIEYRHGKYSYVLEPGDSLSFSGNVPHGPERLIKLPIRFLAIIVYGSMDLSA